VSYAVLLAEELFASGCRLLISMTSAGRILPVREPPYFLIVDRALRDEGTSYHYLPPSDWSTADPGLAVEMEAAALYAFAQARQKPVLCLAHITNQMGRIEGDFEKGAADGAEDSLEVIARVTGSFKGR
jgi:uridine phosphorylase